MWLGQIFVCLLFYGRVHPIIFSPSGKIKCHLDFYFYFYLTEFCIKIYQVKFILILGNFFFYLIDSSLLFAVSNFSTCIFYKHTPKPTTKKTLALPYIFYFRNYFTLTFMTFKMVGHFYKNSKSYKKCMYL